MATMLETRKKIETGTFEFNGVTYWSDTGNIVPVFMFQDAGMSPSQKHVEAYERHLEQQLVDIREEAASKARKSEAIRQLFLS